MEVELERGPGRLEGLAEGTHLAAPAVEEWLRGSRADSPLCQPSNHGLAI